MGEQKTTITMASNKANHHNEIKLNHIMNYTKVTNYILDACTQSFTELCFQEQIVHIES